MSDSHHQGIEIKRWFPCYPLFQIVIDIWMLHICIQFLANMRGCEGNCVEGLYEEPTDLLNLLYFVTTMSMFGS